MKNNNIYIYLLLTVFMGLYSCDDTLSEVPDNRTFIDSKEKISELLVGAYPQGGYAPFLEPMTDNADDKGPLALQNIRVNEEMYYWRDLDDIDEDTPTNYWNIAYEAISHANQALESIEELGSGEDLNGVKAEALMCRAYAHFMLVNIFSQAYNPATADTDMGIPYLLEPETNFIQIYSRGTVSEVYDNIRNDVEQSLDLYERASLSFEVPQYHFTEQAAHAFASRFYLVLGEWQKVIDHGTMALGSGGPEVLRDMSVYRESNFDEQGRLYSSTDERANLLLAAGSSTFARFNFRARYQLTTSVQDEIYAGNATGGDWDYRLLNIGGDLGTAPYKYVEYFRTTNASAGIGFAFSTFVLLTTDEALMNRAEAYAMLGEYDNALNDINLMFSTKIQNYSSVNVLSNEDVTTYYEVEDSNLYTPFYTIPADALPYVNAVLSMKRTIFYHEGLRFLDIKRHEIEVRHLDYLNNEIGVLGKDDPRKALQIPATAQAFEIEANPR
ncbi:RagB/SusD family nutrient uptake outer membrane protein [Winogradskyella bathintestinalis]|uniref:RagB/SusD family nutrient uptake outer membrane protein n=1 Tax=Winogradskyella bathintestinalis TaxID=3035208 RepID=A0ABT7ZXT0_9FLAO|nr:RagB/SusD family nutrient uptake outer membrane protein [Winogradskyella bathintestinalis]MDN3493801.1 RagB/SusD family nutrient uptake outer membrane protein [Winogradskyella bathintestinalis]